MTQTLCPFPLKFIPAIDMFVALINEALSNNPVLNFLSINIDSTKLFFLNFSSPVFVIFPINTELVFNSSNESMS